MRAGDQLAAIRIRKITRRTQGFEGQVYHILHIFIIIFSSLILLNKKKIIYLFRLIETARLLRSVRNVFRRPNTAADGALGQTELELSRKQT